MNLQLLFSAALLLILGNHSFVYTQDYLTFEETAPLEAKDTVQLTIDSSFVEEYSSEELKKKISLYTKLQCAGIGILFSGVGSVIYGFSTATREVEEDTMISLVSVAFVGDGFIAFFGGIVMSAIMNKKVSEYKSRLGRVSFNLDRRNQFTGLKMTCKF